MDQYEPVPIDMSTHKLGATLVRYPLNGADPLAN